MSKPKRSGQDPADDIPENKPVEETDLSAELEGLQARLAEAESKAKENLEGWQRERADFANYKRRIDRDQQTLRETITGDVIRKYLAVQDDMDRAIKARAEHEGDLAGWAAGIDLIARKLQSILDQEGIQRIPAEGVEFDPTLHEAITYEESPDHEHGQVIGVVQEGYKLGDRVLRPSRVRVAR